MAFIVEHGRSHDPVRNLAIGGPRIEPLSDEVGTSLSFEFFVRRGPALISTVAFTGHIIRLPDRSERRVFGLTEDDIRFNLEERAVIAPELGDMPFLMYLAEGLEALHHVTAYAPMEGVVVTTRAALEASGLSVDHERLSPDGQYVLSRWFSPGSRPSA